MKLTHSLKPRNYFTNLFLHISTVVVLIVIFLSIFLYIAFEHFSIEATNKSTDELLYQITSNAENTSKYAKSYMLSILNNPSAIELINNVNIPQTEIVKCYLTLGKTLSAAPYIHSIYIYNNKTRHIYSLGAYEQAGILGDGFFDKEITQHLVNMDQSKNLKPFARLLVNPNKQPGTTEPVYTYILSQYNIFDPSVKSAIVVNIKAQDMFNSFDSNKNNNVVVVDKSGNIIGNNDNKLFLSNISSNDYINKMLSQEGSHGNFTALVNKEKSIVTYHNSQELNWTFFIAMPYKSITNNINSIKNISLFICLLIIIIGLYVSFVMSKSIYKPIKSLKKVIKSSSRFSGKEENKGEDNINDLDYILSNFTTMFDKIKSLEKFKNVNIKTFKAQFLNNFLTQNYYCIQNIDEIFKKNDVNINPYDKMLFFIFKIDNYTSFHDSNSEHDQSLYKFAMCNVIEELTSESFVCEVFDSGKDNIVTIINVSSDENIYQQISVIIESVQNIFQKNFDISLSGFIGNICDDIENVSSIYSNLIELSNLRLLFGHQCILTSDNLISDKYTSSTLDDEMNEKMLMITSNLSVGKMQDATEKYMEIVSNFSTLGYDDIMLTLSKISFSIFNALNTIQKNSSLSFDYDFVSFNSTLSSLETMDQINDEFIKLFIGITATLDNRKDNLDKNIVSKIINIVNQEYSEINLSPITIFDRFKMSSNYLGKKFKDQVGQSISEYIRDVRLEKAKELLLTSNYTIYEILSKIGWENEKYFYTVFKKMTGVTPIEFKYKNNDF